MRFKVNGVYFGFSHDVVNICPGCTGILKMLLVPEFYVDPFLERMGVKKKVMGESRVRAVYLEMYFSSGDLCFYFPYSVSLVHICPKKCPTKGPTK